MRSPRTTPTSRLESGGFSLIELLAAITVAGVSLAAATTFYAAQARNMREVNYRIEAQQAMRGSLDAIARDVRLGGACLPSNGQFVALSGTNGATDSITVTTGLVQANMSCIITATTALVNNGQTNIPVASTTGFTTDMLAYLRDLNGSGESARISSVGANSITLATVTTQQYPSGSGVYAIDERKYEVDSSLAYPRLMLTVNRGTPQAFAAGVRDLQVQYILNRNCPTCDVVDAPAIVPPDTATWRLVNEVIVTAQVDTIGAVSNVSLTEQTRAKPRNLLP